jgi:hypothetical protein
MAFMAKMQPLEKNLERSEPLHQWGWHILLVA